MEEHETVDFTDQKVKVRQKAKTGHKNPFGKISQELSIEF